MATVLAFVLPSAAQTDVRTTLNTVQLAGGSGARAWTITYGRTADLSSHLLELSSERAYFAEGGWVRLIDTTQGLVLGRWHIGTDIVGLKPAGEEQVEVEVADRNFRCKPDWAPGNCPQVHDRMLVGPTIRVPLLQSEDQRLMLRDAGAIESTRQFAPFGVADVLPERARELLPRASELVHRDPYLPWARLVYAHLLEQAGDQPAATAYADVLGSPGGDFTEWLPIAAWLFAHHQEAAARGAYDRGYKDFLERGYDPRAFLSVAYRNHLYTPTISGEASLASLPPEQMERAYRLAPYAEPWNTWQEYAERTADADVWRTRARDARENAPELESTFRGRLYLWGALASTALIALGALIFLINRHYMPERRAEIESGHRQWAVPFFSNLRYWTRRERLVLLLIVVAGWLAVGMAGVYAAAFARNTFAPAAVKNGNYAGQNARWHLQRLPASPERNLLLGIAYQQGGDSRRAEETYRKLPQFAEAWNNIGVLLARRRRSDEARQAFQRALQISPQLSEAAFNADGSTPDFWAALHRQYLPDKPMLAVARARQLRTAYIGGSGLRFYLWSALRGPFWPVDAYFFPPGYLPTAGHSDRWLRRGTEAISVAFLVLAVITLSRRRAKAASATAVAHSN